MITMADEGTYARRMRKALAPMTEAERAFPGTRGDVPANTDLYTRQDPAGQADYHEYMAKIKDKMVDQKYHREQAAIHRASDTGHNSATQRTIDEIARRLAARDRGGR